MSEATRSVSDEAVNSLDAGSIRFLKALRTSDDEWLDTTELREATQLNKDKVNYRFKKLDDLEFIDVQGGEMDDGGTITPKEARITERGRIALASLLEEDTDELHELNERVNELNEEVYQLRRALDDAGIHVPEN